MESPGSRRLAELALRSFRRQLNPMLYSGVVLDQQGFGALSAALGVEGLVDSKPRDSLSRSQLMKDEVLARDRGISHWDALIDPTRNGEVGHVPAGWNRLRVMNSLLRSGTHPVFAKDFCLENLNELMPNSAERELTEQLVFARRSGRHLSRFVSDYGECSREASSLEMVVADSPVEACNSTCAEQAVRPRNGVSCLASLLNFVEGGLGLSVLLQDNIPYECSSVKRKRKKKMNKHKQRKLRRRDRHRNS